ncbi:MAG: HAD family hydrolase [Chloroflexia bacterium]
MSGVSGPPFPHRTMPLQAVIFDMDGLMIDSEPVQLRATNSALDPLGVRIAETEWAGMVGRRAIDMLADLKSKYGFDADIHDVQRAKNAFYRDLIAREVPPMPGLYEAIEVCKQAGLRLALASSSIREDISLVLASLHLQQTFEVIVSGDQVTHGKPHPDIFRAAARRLGVPPENCLVLEDTAHGIQAAKAAGMFACAVPNRFTAGQDFRQADAVLASLADLKLALPESPGG